MGLFSPVIRSYLQRVAPQVQGRLLDVGCGGKPYRGLFTAVTDYVGMDLPSPGQAGGGRTVYRELAADVFGDAHALPFEQASFDAVLATQVIEHLREPDRFFDEAARVLRPGGVLIVTFPLINPLHEEPHDYYRFTHYAVQDLCSRRSLVVEQTVRMGGGWLAVGYLVRVMLGAAAEHGDSSLRARFRLSVGDRLYRFAHWLDLRDPHPEATLNYLMVARKSVPRGIGPP